MRIGARIHASVAARAILQVENEQALRFHQSLRKKLVDGNAMDHLQTLLVGSAALDGDRFQAAPNAGGTRNHVPKIFTGNTYQFDVVERGASRGANAATQQSNFTEIIAARKIG